MRAEESWTKSRRVVDLPITVADSANQCAHLAVLRIPHAAFSLPTGGATVSGTSIVHPDAKKGTSEYCRVTGEIASVQTENPPIRFQINLPSRWNRKTVQFGGGGFNGIVISGTDNFISAPGSISPPLDRGYATFGGDSGHSGMNGKFGLNAEALANFCGESVKRTRDLAVAIMKAYYGRAPQRTYYIGGSKGGHEALVAAQRYGADYDGAIAYYPANQNQAMVLSWHRILHASRGSSWLNPAKQKLLHQKELESCDELDGVADGIISNVEGCRKVFAVAALRCKDGVDTGDSCLSDPQINGLMTAAIPLEFAFPLAFGVTGVGPYPVFAGGDVQGIVYGPNDNGLATVYNILADGVIRYFIQQDESSKPDEFNYLAWQRRIQQISTLYDATNPDLDTFKGHGGKLIIVQGTTDMLVAPAMTTAYFNQVSARYGSQTKDFVRYYVEPGFGHGGGAFNLQWDSLSALEQWSEHGRPPFNRVATDANSATKGRSRPICEYPAWPKYSGAGDVNRAASFGCVVE